MKYNLAADMPRLRFLVVFCFAIVSSSCASLLRAVTWPFDPTPVMVIFNEGGPCTILIGQLSYTIQPDEKNKGTVNIVHPIYGMQSSGVGCLSNSNPNSGTSVSFVDRLDLDGTTDTNDRITRVFTDEVLHAIPTNGFKSGDIYYGMTVNTWATGSGLTCIVGFSLENVRFVMNVGPEKKMHVLLGNGTRRCTHPGYGL